jgi:hypothetical protein
VGDIGNVVECFGNGVSVRVENVDDVLVGRDDDDVEIAVLLSISEGQSTTN